MPQADTLFEVDSNPDLIVWIISICGRFLRCPYSTLVDYVGDFINPLVPSTRKQLIQSFWDLSKDPFKAL